MHERRMLAIRTATLASLLLVAVGASAVEKWNFATPYNEKEYLTINDQAFVKDLADTTKGAIEITIHANASLFKLPEIKRAVQTRQVAIGEVFLSAWANEDPIYAVQTLPFLASNIKS